MKRLLLLLIGILAVIPMSQASAQTPTPFPTPNPTASTFNNVAVFRNLLVAGDQFYVFKYFISYPSVSAATPVPTGVAVSQTFLVRLLDASGVQKGQVAPSMIGHPTLGYNYGVVSIYLLSAAAPAWGCACVLELDANPGINGLQGVAKQLYTLQAGDFNSSSVQATNMTDLGNWVLNRADEIESTFSPAESWTTVSQLGRLLTTDGSVYFTAAIPGLFNMAPAIFQVRSFLPTVVPATFSLTAQAGFAVNDNIVGAPLAAVGATFGMTRFTFGFLMVMAAVIGCIVFSAAKTGNATPGAIMALPIIALAPLVGFISLTITFVLLLFMILIIGFALFMRTA